LKSGEEITVEIESGKSLIIKFLPSRNRIPMARARSFFELNGQPAK